MLIDLISLSKHHPQSGLPAKFETEIIGLSRIFQDIFPYIPGLIPYKFQDFPGQESIYPGFSRI